MSIGLAIVENASSAIAGDGVFVSAEKYRLNCSPAILAGVSVFTFLSKAGSQTTAADCTPRKAIKPTQAQLELLCDRFPPPPEWYEEEF